MKRIALKIDVDTFHGALHGVPTLIDLLKSHSASGTFFVTLGPDRSGRQPRRNSLKTHYDFATRLNGRFLPAPTIGARAAKELRAIKDAGFEIGLRAWDRVLWEQQIGEMDNASVESAMCKAVDRFENLFGAVPAAFAAPGWLTNRHALRLTQRLGFAYASDCRGDRPFIPVIDGEIVRCPQIPTTLPALDEVMTIERSSTADQAADRLFSLSKAIDGDHVFTLRAELEGMRFRDTFNRLVARWTEAGIELVSLDTLASSISLDGLPRCVVSQTDIAGRYGARFTQGEIFLE